MPSIPTIGRRLVALSLPLMAACYVYVPVEQPSPGSQVRASLTVEGAVRQSDVMGRPMRNFNGRFVSLDSETLALDVITASTRGQLREIVLRDTLSIPRDQVMVIEGRELSWVRTGVIGAGAAAAVVVIFNSLTSGGENVPGDGGPIDGLDGITIPIFQIRR